jgi:prophage antirepressor-like protein
MLNIFEYENQEIRFVDGKPVANDVAKVLGYVDPAKTVSTKVNLKNRSVTKMVTVDGKLRDITVLEEAGIYQLIFGSKLPSAEKFQDWVFEEVLPSIRKTGSYSIPENKEVEPVDVFKAIDYTEKVVLLKGEVSEAMRQIFFDQITDKLLTQGSIKLTQTRKLGVAQKAEELGYKIDHSIRVKLGKFVKNQGLPFSEEERLCNGQLRKIKVYEDTPELERIIHLFFDGVKQLESNYVNS